MKKRLYKYAIFLIVIEYIFIWNSVASETGLTASGYLTATFYDPVGHIMPSPIWGSTNRFQILLASDGKYVLKVTPLQEEDDTMYQAFDGTNTIFVRYRESDIDMFQNIIGRTSLDKKVNPGYVSSGNYPFVPWDAQKRTSILWMVYSAGNYLHDSNTNTMPLPWVPARWSLMAYGFRVESQLSTNPPYIPLNIRFLRDDIYDLSEDLEMERPELDAASTEIWISQWKAQYLERKRKWKNGFMAGELESSNFTNYNGLDVPLVFSVKTYSPDWNVGDKIHWRYYGYITNISGLNSNELFQPPIIGTVGVDDSRFRVKNSTKAINSIHYTVNDTHRWCSRDDPERLKQLQAGLASREVSARLVYGNVRTKRLILAALFLVSAMFLPLYLYFAAKQNQTKNKK